MTSIAKTSREWVCQRALRVPWARGPRMLRNSVQLGLLLLERLLVLEGLLMEGLLRGGPLLRSLLHPSLRPMRRRRPDLSH